MAGETQTATCTMNYQNKTQLINDSAVRLGRLSESLKAWNLMAALYASPEKAEHDLPGALAARGRDIVIYSVRLTHQLVLAGLAEDAEQFDTLLAKLDATDERERRIAKQFNLALRGIRKEVA